MSYSPSDRCMECGKFQDCVCVDSTDAVDPCERCGVCQCDEECDPCTDHGDAETNRLLHFITGGEFL